MYTSTALISLLLPLFLLFALPQQGLSATMAATKSFSLELIPGDSINSPLYAGNLSFREKLSSYYKSSEFREASLVSIPNSTRATQPDLMRPSVYYYIVSYLVELSVGTPPKRNLLLLDTGSRLTWIQCQPCKSCFSQRYPIFDPRSSSSYQKLPCSHPYCRPPLQCVNGECLYQIWYRDGSSTKGVASQDVFTVVSHKNGPPVTHLLQVTYGCSNDNQNFPESQYGYTAGILGLNRDPISLIRQFEGYILDRFSYCLPTPLPDGRYPATYLKFGVDMGYRGGGYAQVTPFVNHTDNMYHLNLLDISVNGQRLNYPPQMFDIKPEGTGGCIIDSGTALTRIYKDAFWVLAQELEHYFDKFRLESHECPPGYHLCYALPDGFDSFPSMTLHFEGANLEISPENVFIINRQEKQFILGILPSEVRTVLGAWQQRNTRIIYDLYVNALIFAPENCSEDKAG